VDSLLINCTMDLPLLHSCTSRSLLESHCVCQSSRLFSRRRSSPLLFPAQSLVPFSDRIFLRILCNSIRRDAYSIQESRWIGNTRIPVENSPGVGQSHLGFWVQPLRRRKFCTVHFEQGDRDCSDGDATNLENGERPPFDLDLAVVLAGFSFEAYNTPAVLNTSHFDPLFTKLT